MERCFILLILRGRRVDVVNLVSCVLVLIVLVYILNDKLLDLWLGHYAYLATVVPATTILHLNVVLQVV